MSLGTWVDVELFRQPLGVVAGICPYNFPAMIPLWMFPIAIACGNAFILKPSERTPKTANLLAELVAEAGVPEGVFNVVHGGRDVVDGERRPGESSESAAARLPNLLQARVAALALPTRLPPPVAGPELAGVLATMAEQALASGSPQYNPWVPDGTEITAIYGELFAG